MLIFSCSPASFLLALVFTPYPSRSAYPRYRRCSGAVGRICSSQLLHGCSTRGSATASSCRPSVGVLPSGGQAPTPTPVTPLLRAKRSLWEASPHTPEFQSAHPRVPPSLEGRGLLPEGCSPRLTCLVSHLLGQQ